MNVPLLNGFLDILFHDSLLSEGQWINAVVCGHGTRQEVNDAVIQFVRLHATGFNFAEHLTKVMIYFCEL